MLPALHDVRVLLPQLSLVRDLALRQVVAVPLDAVPSVGLAEGIAHLQPVQEGAAQHRHATGLVASVDRHAQLVRVEGTLEGEGQVLESASVVLPHGVRLVHTRLSIGRCDGDVDRVAAAVLVLHVQSVPARLQTGHDAVAGIERDVVRERRVLVTRLIAHEAVVRGILAHDGDHGLRRLALRHAPQRANVVVVGVGTEGRVLHPDAGHVGEGAEVDQALSVRLKRRGVGLRGEAVVHCHAHRDFGKHLARRTVHLDHVLRGAVLVQTTEHVERGRNRLHQRVLLQLLRAVVEERAAARQRGDCAVVQRHIAGDVRAHRLRALGNAEGVDEVLGVVERLGRDHRLRLHALHGDDGERDGHVAQQRHGERDAVQRHARTEKEGALLVPRNDRLVVHVAGDVQGERLGLHEEGILGDELPVRLHLLANQHLRRLRALGRREVRHDDLLVVVQRVLSRVHHGAETLLHTTAGFVHDGERIAGETLAREDEQRAHPHEEAAVAAVGDEVDDEHASVVDLREGEGLDVLHDGGQLVAVGVGELGLQTVHVQRHCDVGVVLLVVRVGVHLVQADLQRLDALQFHLDLHLLAGAVRPLVRGQDPQARLLAKSRHLRRRENGRFHFLTAHQHGSLVDAEEVVHLEVGEIDLHALRGEEMVENGLHPGGNAHVVRHHLLLVQRLLLLRPLALHLQVLQQVVVEDAHLRLELEQALVRVHQHRRAARSHEVDTAIVHGDDAVHFRGVVDALRSDGAEAVQVLVAELGVREEIDLELLQTPLLESQHVVKGEEVEIQLAVSHLLQRRVVEDDVVHHARKTLLLCVVQEVLGVLLIAIRFQKLLAIGGIHVVVVELFAQEGVDVLITQRGRVGFGRIATLLRDNGRL